MRFKALRCSTIEEFRAWVADEVRRAQQENTDGHGRARTGKATATNEVRGGPCLSVSPRDLPAVLAANGALSLLNLCIHLVDRQMEAQAEAFEREGGFTERLYRRRRQRRDRAEG
jgi:four helix bundle suffix protein